MGPEVYPFFIASGILIAGFIASIMLREYGIPDSLFLIVIGILIGHFAGLQAEFGDLAPYIGSLALITIMFESSLGINLHELIESAKPAVILALTSFSLSLIGASLFVHLALGMSWMESILYGSIVGGSSGIIIAAMASKIGLPPSLQLILSLESILTDVFCIVSAIVVLIVMSEPNISSTSIAGLVASKFSVSFVLGFICGLVLSTLLYRLKKYKHIYMATLATLIFLYSAVEALGGTGAIAVLVAGIILANLEYLPTFVSSSEKIETLRFQRVFLESFHSELTLLIKVFFFVEIGLVFSSENISYLLMAVTLSLLFIPIRYPAALLASKLAGMIKSAPLITVFYARGLAAAVLAFLPGVQALPNAQFFAVSVSGIILTTNAVLTFGYIFFKRRISEDLIV